MICHLTTNVLTPTREHNAVITHQYLHLVCMIIGTLLLSFSLNSYAMPQSQPSLIQKTAADHIKQALIKPDFGSIKVTAAKLDSRLRFPPCSTPLLASTPGKQTLSGNAGRILSLGTDTTEFNVDSRPRGLYEMPNPSASVPHCWSMAWPRDRDID